MLKSYLKEIYEISQLEDAREESYYAVLVALLKTYANKTSKTNLPVRQTGIHITTLPKKTEAGNPDFRLHFDSKTSILAISEKQNAVKMSINEKRDVRFVKNVVSRVI